MVVVQSSAMCGPFLYALGIFLDMLKPPSETAQAILCWEKRLCSGFSIRPGWRFNVSVRHAHAVEIGSLASRCYLRDQSLSS